MKLYNYAHLYAYVQNYNFTAIWLNSSILCWITSAVHTSTHMYVCMRWHARLHACPSFLASSTCITIEQNLVITDVRLTMHDQGCDRRRTLSPCTFTCMQAHHSSCDQPCMHIYIRTYCSIEQKWAIIVEQWSSKGQIRETFQSQGYLSVMHNTI